VIAVDFPNGTERAAQPSPAAGMVGHIASRDHEGVALCGVRLPVKRIGGEPRPGIFCAKCEQVWDDDRRTSA
jgi:hypothetical protein